MRILQCAVRVVRHVHAEVLLVERIPALGYLLGVQLAVEHRALELVAHHYVQAVGELIGLDTDEPRLGGVDRTVEHVCIVPAELRAEPHELRPDQAAEGSGASDYVLEEAGLALMHAHGNAAAELREGVFLRCAQLVERVSALVDDAEHRGGEGVLVILRRDAHIVARKVDGEGVLRSRESAPVRVEAEEAHEPARELVLLVEREADIQQRGVGRLRRADLCYERHEL